MEIQPFFSEVQFFCLVNLKKQIPLRFFKTELFILFLIMLEYCVVQLKSEQLHLSSFKLRSGSFTEKITLYGP